MDEALKAHTATEEDKKRVLGVLQRIYQVGS